MPGSCRPCAQPDHVATCVKVRQHPSRVRRDKFQMSDLPQDGLFYLSIDIDALDPALAHATNTGVDRGFLYDEFFLLRSNIMTSRNIIGIDLVKIQPKKDVHDKTMKMALKIILFCLAKWS